jgi:hypothetical protein
MAAAATVLHRPHPVLPGIPCRVEVIVLDGEQTIRVRQDGRAIGYFPTPDAAAAHGVDLATAIIGGTP